MIAAYIFAIAMRDGESILALQLAFLVLPSIIGILYVIPLSTRIYIQVRDDDLMMVFD